MTFIYIMLATILISFGSFVGLLSLNLKGTKLVLLVSLSAGSLMGSAFLHLLPEAGQFKNGYLLTLSAFVFFLLIEKTLHWHHTHDDRTIGYMNLIGDLIHNFLDGLIIAAAFSTSVGLGLTTCVAVALHEIPQEIGDLGILMYYGFNKTKAILLNFLVASACIAGGIIGYFWLTQSSMLTPILIPIAAGGFIYIAASDLVPEIKRQEKGVRSAWSFLTFLIGIIIMYAMTFIE